MPFLNRSRPSTIWPSVIYPVRSGIGCVMSSAGIDRIGTCVTLPFLPLILPARSQLFARSVQRQPGYPFLPGTSSLAALISRSASAQLVMSVSIASTCIPRSNARYSATVSATLGVMILSIAGSSAKLRNSTERLNAPDSSRLRLKYCASEYCTPIAAKTTAKSSFVPTTDA